MTRLRFVLARAFAIRSATSSEAECAVKNTGMKPGNDSRLSSYFSVSKSAKQQAPNISEAV